MPKHKVEAPDVDLRCILCPKTPTFSDISHLLTHIASKSHLSYRFKLQVESRNQQEARDKLDDFEFWYNTNKLDEMLVDRLAAKEDKKEKKTRGSVTIKREARTLENDLDNAFRAPRANMHHLPSQTSTLTLTPRSQARHIVYSTPMTRSKVPHFSNPDTAPISDNIDPLLTTPWKQEPHKEAAAKHSMEKVPTSDSAKLKGIQWPGMRVFDAATPEGKRMRNQRKDSKVLRDMIATSRGVEPAEISYHANGEFRASRDIFGPLSAENSPVQLRRPSPKKRKVRKPTFNSVSVNAPRARLPRAKKAAINSLDAHKSVALANPYRRSSVYSHPLPTLNPLATGFSSGYNSMRYMASVDEEEEYKMTAGEFGKKKGFAIFEDAPSPGRTESPLEEPQFDYANHGLPIFPTHSMNSDNLPSSPTPLARPASRIIGGVNGTHGINVLGGGDAFHGQADMTHQVHGRRALSDSQVFAPHAFHHDFNPLFSHANHGYTRSFNSYSPAHYMLGDSQGTSYYAHNNMNRSPNGYSSSFMGDFRQMNEMTGSLNPQAQGSAFSSGLDIATARRDGGMHFNV